jgi:hypothetical protein
MNWRGLGRRPVGTITAFVWRDCEKLRNTPSQYQWLRKDSKGYFPIMSQARSWLANTFGSTGRIITTKSVKTI